MGALDMISAPASTDEDLIAGNNTPLSSIDDEGTPASGGALGALSKQFMSQAQNTMPVRDDVLEKRQMLDQALQKLSAEQSQPLGYDPGLAGFAAGIAGARTGAGTPGDQGIAAMHAANLAEMQRQIGAQNTRVKAAENWPIWNQQDIENATKQEQLAEQASATAATAGFKVVQPVHLPNGQTIFVNKLTGQQISGTGGGGTMNGGIPPKIASILQENNLDPAGINAPLDKDEVKTNGDEYQKAVAANDGAREAAASAQKVLPALQNYQAGLGSTEMASVNAMLPTDWQNKSLQNTQEINKMSGTIATQIAAGLKNTRLGIGMDRFIKSTTISPDNAPPVNAWIAQNIIDSQGVTKNVQDLAAYTKSLKPQYGSAVINKFYDDNPMVLDSSDAPDGAENIGKINPAYKDPQLFRKWLYSSPQGNPAAPAQNTQVATQPAANAQPATASALPTITSKEDALKLPSGTHFIGPDGQEHVRK